MKARARTADFDRAYRADQLEAHADAAALLDAHTPSGGNVPLKVWVARTLPTGQKHREQLQALPASPWRRPATSIATPSLVS